jgi:hypothetical protein
MSGGNFDDLDRKKLDETYKNVKLLMEQLARLQEQVDRKYLRQIIRRLREKVIMQKGYINELESRLRL